MPKQLRTYTTMLLLALMAQGWNLIGGYTGYAAFGNAGFFGIGAYTTGLLMLSPWQVPFFLALAAGALLAALVAALIGLPGYAIGRLGMARTFQIVKPFRQLTVRDNVAIGAMFGAGGARLPRPKTMPGRCLSGSACTSAASARPPS
jgi:branched-chain amino acid transport system permease protein